MVPQLVYPRDEHLGVRNNWVACSRVYEQGIFSNKSEDLQVVVVLVVVSADDEIYDNGVSKEMIV